MEHETDVEKIVEADAETGTASASTASTKKLSIQDILGMASRQRQTAIVVLDGAAEDERQILEEEIKNLPVEEMEKAVALSERVLELEQRIADTTVKFVFESMPRGAWQALSGKHPPTSDQRKAGLPVNEETFMVEAISACCIDPVMTVDETKQLYQQLGNSQWALLCRAVLSANEDSTSPKVLPSAIARVLISKSKQGSPGN